MQNLKLETQMAELTTQLVVTRGDLEWMRLRQLWATSQLHAPGLLGVLRESELCFKPKVLCQSAFDSKLQVARHSCAAPSTCMSIAQNVELYTLEQPDQSCLLCVRRLCKQPLASQRGDDGTCGGVGSAKAAAGGYVGGHVQKQTYIVRSRGQNPWHPHTAASSRDVRHSDVRHSNLSQCG